jgi:hypothetical protein
MVRGTLVGILVGAVLAACGPVAAGPLGVGVMLGEPTGLSAKAWTSRETALDLGVAWSFADEVALHVHSDYLVHKPGPPEIEVGGLLFYFGLGGRMKLEEDGNRVGVRVPLGLDYLFAQSHLEFFLEIVPILDLAPETELMGNGGLGIRYYFGGRPRTRQL